MKRRNRLSQIIDESLKRSLMLEAGDMSNLIQAGLNGIGNAMITKSASNGGGASNVNVSSPTSSALSNYTAYLNGMSGGVPTPSTSQDNNIYRMQMIDMMKNYAMQCAQYGMSQNEVYSLLSAIQAAMTETSGTGGSGVTTSGGSTTSSGGGSSSTGKTVSNGATSKTTSKDVKTKAKASASKITSQDAAKKAQQGGVTVDQVDSMIKTNNIKRDAEVAAQKFRETCDNIVNSTQDKLVQGLTGRNNTNSISKLSLSTTPTTSYTAAPTATTYGS